jgi:hypothetical protein
VRGCKQGVEEPVVSTVEPFESLQLHHSTRRFAPRSW